MIIKVQLPLVFTAILFAAVAQAKTATEVFEIASPSVVIIKTYDAIGKGQSLGSGVVLKDGVVVTNCHVVKEAVTMQVVRQGTIYPANLRDTDWDRDVCTLSVEGLEGHAVTKGSTHRLKVGAKVYAVGAPKGLELTLSDGLISNLRQVSGGQYLQITAPISPGSSGGGLFDEEGRLIGLPTFYLRDGQQLNFAVPVEWINELHKRNSTTTGKKTSTEWLNRAMELEGKKDRIGLIEHTLRWTKEQPGSFLAWYNLGGAYSASGQTAKAVEAYRLAIRINPEHSGVWQNLGSEYGNANQTSKAIEAYLQAIRINPEDSYVWINLISVYGESGQIEKAIEAHQQAIRIDPENDSPWINIGVVYGYSGQKAKEVEAYQQAIRIDPESAVAWYNVGYNYLNSKQFEKAMEAFQQALRFNPDYASAWVNLGNVYDSLGQNAKAIEAYQQAIGVAPEDAVAWKNIGRVYLSSNQFAKAIEAYRQAVRLSPEYANAWYDLGVAYKYSGQYSQVIEVYKRLKSLDSALADRYYNQIVL